MKKKRKQRDSSLTRVKPLFDFIDNDADKLNSFFGLLKSKIPLIEQASLQPICYGTNEKVIPPSKSLLVWLLKNLNELNKFPDYGVKRSSPNYPKREKLFSGDQESLKEAIELINTKKQILIGEWYTFEGPTHPDIFIETCNSIIVGEAKRTESSITTKTKWQPYRDQLIRHIDPFLDQPKSIYSFYILDKVQDIKGRLSEKMKLYNEEDYFRNNLKHRDKSSVLRAKDSFMGFVFWDEVEKHFNLTFPDTIEELV